MSPQLFVYALSKNRFVETLTLSTCIHFLMEGRYRPADARKYVVFACKQDSSKFGARQFETTVFTPFAHFR